MVCPQYMLGVVLYADSLTKHTAMFSQCLRTGQEAKNVPFNQNIPYFSTMCMRFGTEANGSLSDTENMLIRLRRSIRQLYPKCNEHNFPQF